MDRIVSYVRENKTRVTALFSAVVITLLVIAPNIVQCALNGARTRHLSSLYRLDYAITGALEAEINSGRHKWHELVSENNSKKLLSEVSAAFFGGRISVSDFYAENDGVFLILSSLKYPDMKTLKIKIPEFNE